MAHPGILMRLPTEVLLIVFRCLTPDPLSALAKTCKFLSSLALSELWRHVGLLPLNSLVEAYVCSTRSTDVDNRTRLSKSRKWERFQFYASFIKTINLEPSPDQGDAELLAGNLKRLAKLTPSTPLFPNLRVFSYNNVSWPVFRRAGLFLGPSLDCVKIKQAVPLALSTLPPVYDAAFNDLIELIRTRAPTLQTLVLPISSEHSSLVPAILQLLQALPYLRLFETGSLGFRPQLFRSLAHHKRLRTLLVMRSGTTQAQDLHMFTDECMGEGPLFETLETFYMESQATLQVLPRVIHYVRYSPLRQLSLSGDVQDVDSTAFTRMADSIGSNCPHLRTFYLLLSHYSRSSSSKPAIEWKWLTGLLLCHRMESLKLRVLTSGSFDVADEQIDAMAKAWPALRRLYLECGNRAVVDTDSVSLASVLSLTRHCPRLEHFYLPYFQTVKIPALSSLNSTSSHVPLELVIRSSRATKINAPKIAVFLSALRSNILFSFHDMCPSEVRAEWENVGREITAISQLENRCGRI